jgi:microsomal dipeptidase-like Zn-dependent dipeptidase
VIADFHAHYAMLLGAEHGTDPIRPGGSGLFSDRLRFGLVRFLSRFANYESFSSGPRVTVPSMREGGVGVALSVLYRPFCEIDFSQRYGAPPRPGYLDALVRQLELVEQAIEANPSEEVCVARSPAELEAALAAGRTALVHCVEGGFHLGATAEAIDEAVTALSRRGVAYVTLAHLFWRSVATNSPAIPFIPDRIYRLVFPQPKIGLSKLGEAAVRAMARERILIDVAHMDRHALDRTFALLDEIDPDNTVPVVATHSGYRFGSQTYNLDERTVRRIAERDGVIGLIFAEHQASDGVREKRTASFDDSFAVLCAHVDRIRAIAGSHRHTGIGSDLDGYIKPTLAGLGDMRAMRPLEQALVERYGADDGGLIASGNIVRLLRTWWRGRPQ